MDAARRAARGGQFTQWISRRAQTKRGRRRRERWVRRARGETVAGADRETRRATRNARRDGLAGARFTVRSQKKWVTKAYRELAKLLHPDKCSAPGAKEAFQKLNKAYGALK